MSEYTEQANRFLEQNGIKFRATLSDSKTPPWSEDHAGHHYRVTFSKPRRIATVDAEHTVDKSKRLVFDFWGSIADAEAGRTEIEPYDVLACVSGDIHCPETFEDYCGEMDENADSIKAKQAFNRVSRFAKRLRRFFTEQEIEQLQEIH